MNYRRGSGVRLAGVAVATLMAMCCSQAFAQACTSLPVNSIGPKGIVGQGPNGEKASSVDAVKLTDAEAAKVKAGNFKVGISMQTMNLDWSQLQVQGITDTLKKYGVEVIGTASAEYQVDKQIADIENTIQRHPNGIISIPVDGCDLQESLAGGHQARVHGQRTDGPEAPGGVLSDGLGR
jgi:ribose transport system substrate-binding protein